MKTRAKKIRFKLKKISNRSRLTVFKSNMHLYAQLIDDKKGVTLASVGSVQEDIKNKKFNKKELAEYIGKEIAKKTLSIGIKDVAFDRGNYKYHGLIKILADAARNEGLNF